MIQSLTELLNGIPFFSSVWFGVIAMLIVGGSFCLVGLVMGDAPKRGIEPSLVQLSGACFSILAGLVIMLIALGTHIIKLEQVKEASEFLIEIMPVMFIPAGVGLLTAWGILKPVCVPIILITVITTVVVMIVTGRVTQAVIRMNRKKGQKRS